MTLELGGDCFVLVIRRVEATKSIGSVGSNGADDQRFRGGEE